MQRIRNVSGHVLPNATKATFSHGEQCNNGKVLTTTKKQPQREESRDGKVANFVGDNLTDEEKVIMMKTISEFNESIDKFVTDGTFPDMCAFDLPLATRFEFGFLTETDAGKLLDMADAEGRLDLLGKLPGPWQDCRSRSDQAALVNTMVMTEKCGDNIFRFAEWQLRYGTQGLGSNIVVPVLMGHKSPPAILPRVILADAEDAERIARNHVRKEGNFKPILYNSLIATDDNDHWRNQRHALSDLFLPLSSLAHILPVSLQRAKHCAARLGELTAGGVVADMSDFLLHEAQAQLQLALLGCPEQLMDATNEDVRAVFMGDLKKGKIGALGTAMKAIMTHAQDDPTLAAPGDGRPIKGPLSRGVQSTALTPADNYGNMLLVLFAGHDTTGHTMTWLMFELARNPGIQRRVQMGIDAFYQELGDRDPTYKDFASEKLDLLDRCITETLRLWPAVANGTFRQLQYDDDIKGPSGDRLLLPKGTPVMITNWQRHRNEELWGSDVNEFNPDRDFAEGEITRVGGPLAGMNPQSARFSPFAHNPRSCLGKNFAQMEMRTILTNLLKSFDFTLAAPYDSLVGVTNKVAPGVHEFRGVNRGTMGPMDLESSQQASWGTRHQYAMKMHTIPRQK